MSENQELEKEESHDQELPLYGTWGELSEVVGMQTEALALVRKEAKELRERLERIEKKLERQEKRL